MTAAATTGPNNDPRPTSSTPATSVAPEPHASFSYLRVQWRRFSRRSFMADAEGCFCGRASVCKGTTKRMLAQSGLWAQEEKLSPGSWPIWLTNQPSEEIIRHPRHEIRAHPRL